MAWDDVSRVAPGVVVWKEPVDKTVAHHQDSVDAVQAAAKKLARDAEFVLDNDSRNRTGEARIWIEHAPPRLLDSVVWLESPSNEHPLAAVLSIENGHHTRKKNFEGEGPRPGAGWVPGIGPLRNALAKSLRERKMTVK